MSDIPEGLVEAVKKAIADNLSVSSQMAGDLHYPAIAAIQAHNAWLSDQAPFDGGKVAVRARKSVQRLAKISDDLDERIKAFVTFQGPNPRD